MDRMFKGILLSSLLGFSSLAIAKVDFLRTPLMNFEMSNKTPNSNQAFTIFAHLETDYTSADQVRTVVLGYLDGQEVELRHQTEGLWTANISAQAEGAHTFQTNIGLEDASEADALRAEITTLNQEIAALDSLIPAEEDPAQRAILQASRDQKDIRRNVANSELSQTRIQIGSEVLNFNVTAAAK